MAVFLWLSLVVSVVERSINGMRYLEAGSGWPVVLIHAFPVNADMWRPQLARVPDGWRFIAPDLIGFTPSSDPPAGGPPGMDDYARGIARLLDHLELDTAVIGGLSMGGYVAFALFRLAPERFTGAVLADTRPGPDSADGRAGRVKMRALLADKGPSAIADQMLPKLLSPDADAALVSRVRAMIESTPSHAIDAALAAMMDRPDSTPDLQRMSVPSLVLVGERDEVTPLAEAERMQRLLPRSRLAIVPGAGHLANLQQPDDFSRALHDFLLAPM